MKCTCGAVLGMMKRYGAQEGEHVDHRLNLRFLPFIHTLTGIDVAIVHGPGTKKFVPRDGREV